MSITESQESVYEKTKAIERYFGKSGFVYAQQNVAIPDAGQDYVDQFLFEQKGDIVITFPLHGRHASIRLGYLPVG